MSEDCVEACDIFEDSFVRASARNKESFKCKKTCEKHEV